MVEKRGPSQPKCFLSHDLINKLSVIVGSCEILREETADGQFDSGCAHRLDVIQQIAKAMADALQEHECELDALSKVQLMTAQRDHFQSKIKH